MSSLEAFNIETLKTITLVPKAKGLIRTKRKKLIEVVMWKEKKIPGIPVVSMARQAMIVTKNLPSGKCLSRDDNDYYSNIDDADEES